VILLALILAGVVVAIAGGLYQVHVRRHLPYDLREVGTEGLPNEASIRSGELGRGAASNQFRNM
jgi:hypothetical protein